MEECSKNLQSCPGCKTRLQQIRSDDVIVTCINCGTSLNVVTGERSSLKGSVIPNKKSPEDVSQIVEEWMGGGFQEVRDLAEDSQILETRLLFLPFFIIDVKATSRYEGTSIEDGEDISKSSLLEKAYNWKIIGTRNYDFPTLKYNIPLNERIDLTPSIIYMDTDFYNTQMDEEGARSALKVKIDEHFKDLLSSDLEVITRLDTTLDIGDIYLVYSCVWEILYEYGGCQYRILIDGSSGTIIMGDTPTEDITSGTGFFERLRKSFFG